VIKLKREIPKDGYPIPPYLVAHEGINEEGPPGQIKLTRTRRIEEIGRDI
jgi:hypothetical protein